MNILHSPKSYEMKNEIFVLEEVAKDLEKQQHKISLILNNVKTKDTSRDNLLKLNKSSSVRSKKSPKYFLKLPANRPNKYSNSVISEDLTEVTVTDVITDASDSGHSDNPFFKFNPIHVDINSKHEIMYNKDFILLAPDDSYENVFKFNKHLSEKIDHDKIMNTINNINYKGVNFPLLQISPVNGCHDDSARIKKSEQTPPKIFVDAFINNELKGTNIIKNIELIVSPDAIIRDRFQKKLAQATPKLKTLINEQDRIKTEFIRQNLLNIDLGEPLHSSSLNCSVRDANANANDSSGNVNSVSKELEYNTVLEDKTIDDKTLDILTDSDVVLHHGYIITDDGIIDTKPNRKPKNIGQSFRNQGPFKSTDGICKSSSADGTKNSNKHEHVIFKEKEFFVIETNSENNNYIRNRDTSRENNPVQIQFQDVPILPPDMMGNINLLNGNSVKRFLGVKSIDENGWNDVQNININEDFPQNISKKKLTMVINPENNSINYDKMGIDLYTARVMDPRNPQLNFKRDLRQSLKNMDNKITEMAKISSTIEKEFADSELLLLDFDKLDMDTNIQMKQNLDKERLEKSLISVHNYETENHTGNDITVFSEPSLCSSASEIMDSSTRNLSRRKTPNYSPRHYSHISDNDISVYSYLDSTPKQQLGKNIYPKRMRSRINNNQRRNKFRNETELNNYMRRRKEGKKLAVKMLNLLGLPPNYSTEISVKLSEGPTANQMMLSEMKRNLLSSSARTIESPRQESVLQDYKPIRQKPYLEKVRLQRPEVTRPKKLNRPITYTENLLSLQPAKRVLANKNQLPRERLFTNNSSNNLNVISLISQDTDAISIVSDWSIPDNVHRMLYNDSRGDDPSQLVSIQSNSFIDWDQVSEMIKSPTLK